ncbi:MAG: hypothetical protein IPJ46_04495 [Anaerolineales bacterium]|nr:hypothetical protein [Anaerolineales bacterium]
MSFACGKRQLELLRGQHGESDLCLVKGRFYLMVVCEVETPKPIDVEGVLGVDLGLVQIAATPDGGGFSGAAIEDKRRKFDIAEAICKRNRPNPPHENSRKYLVFNPVFKNNQP